jgi:hypothetical protein
VGARRRPWRPTLRAAAGAWIVCSEGGRRHGLPADLRRRPPRSPYLITHTLKPSELFRRQVWVSFQDDLVAMSLLPFYGEGRLMWASDYPHPDSTWPNSRRIVDKQMGELSPRRPPAAHARQRRRALRPVTRLTSPWALPAPREGPQGARAGALPAPVAGPQGWSTSAPAAGSSSQAFTVMASIA